MTFKMFKSLKDLSKQTLAKGGIDNNEAWRSHIASSSKTLGIIDVV